jgi:hypothetical protein
MKLQDMLSLDAMLLIAVLTPGLFGFAAILIIWYATFP